MASSSQKSSTAPPLQPPSSTSNTPSTTTSSPTSPPPSSSSISTSPQPLPPSTWPTPLDPKPAILLIPSPTHAPSSSPHWPRLSHLFTVHTYAGPPQSLPAYLASLRSQPHASVRAIVRTGWLKAGPYANMRFFATEALAALPPAVELVTCSGHGHDAADVAGLRARGVAYASTPDTCTEAVANAGLHLILGAYRYFSFAERCARGPGVDGDGDGDGFEWQRSRELATRAEDPAGRVLGVVGMGDIGARVAVKAAAALGMRVAYHSRRRKVEAEARLAPFGGAAYCRTLDELWAVADCVCLACPLTEETRGLVGRGTLALMKDGVRIVNVARGGVVDEEALIEAMESGRVAGVGLDVHANEPGVNPKLRDNWMTTLLPHIGVCSKTTWDEFDRVTFQNVEEWFYGDKSKVPVVNR